MLSGGGKVRHINGTMTLLIRKHFPGNVTYAGVSSPPWSWEHFRAVVLGENGPTLAGLIKSEFWVSLHHKTLLSTTHSLE